MSEFRAYWAHVLIYRHVYNVRPRGLVIFASFIFRSRQNTLAEHAIVGVYLPLGFPVTRNENNEISDCVCKLF